MKNKNIIILFGPTAVGKTKLLDNLFQYPVEVISSDSRQIYKDCAISTAQPSEKALEKIPHHFISELHFTQDYNVADFVRNAHKKIIDIHKRGKTPLVCGGTAYYMYHLWKGLPETPKSNPKVRAAVLQDLRVYGIEHLYNELYLVDEMYAQSISSTDTQRIVRALEIYKSTGKKVSEYKSSTYDNNQKEYDYFFIGLERPRSVLHQRIEQRVNIMFEENIIDEVRSLYAQGLRMKHNAAHTIGIQEFLQDSDVISAWDNNKEISTDIVERVKEKIIVHTRQYAKRQMTFLRRFDEVQWFNIDESIKKILDYVKFLCYNGK